MKISPKFYLYKTTVDNGGAPCVKDGLLTVAICKPAIRRTAEKGDIIIGFAATSLYPDNRVVYIAKVTKKLNGREYYSQQQYAKRADSIYRWDGRKFNYRRNAKYHGKEDLSHDLGKGPKYRSAEVVLSREFRYFGKKGRRNLHDMYPRIASVIRSLARGHRVINARPHLLRELMNFASKLWKCRSTYSSTPTAHAHSTTCLRGDGGSIQCQSWGRSTRKR